MSIETKPFVAKTLLEERPETKGRIISLRLNEEELATLKHFMDVLDSDNEGRCIKILMSAGLKVIQRDLGDDTLKWMSRRGRARVLGIQEGN